jgi:hypothetical protein
MGINVHRAQGMSVMSNLSLFQPGAVIVGEGCLFDDAMTQLVMQ